MLDNRNCMITYSNCSDFLLMPTRRETQGISYAETCSWGVPIIATNAGGVSGTVSDTVNGILLKEQDEPILYGERMMAYISNLDKYTYLAESIYRYFCQNLSRDAIGKKIDKELYEAVSKRKVNKYTVCVIGKGR